MRTIQLLILAGLTGIGISTSGCSSHLVSSSLPDGSCAAGDCDLAQTSIFGNAGISSNAASGAIPAQCNTNGFTRVEVDRNLGQGLVTVLTMGAVNPATIRFSCAKPAQTAEMECAVIPGTAEEGTLDYIECVRKGTNETPEPVRFDCQVLPVAPGSDQIGEFTCKQQDAAWLNPASLPLPAKG
jgi:hypothetical protein